MARPSFPPSEFPPVNSDHRQPRFCLDCADKLHPKVEPLDVSGQTPALRQISRMFMLLSSCYQYLSSYKTYRRGRCVCQPMKKVVVGQKPTPECGSDSWESTAQTCSCATQTLDGDIGQDLSFLCSSFFKMSFAMYEFPPYFLTTKKR